MAQHKTQELAVNAVAEDMQERGWSRKDLAEAADLDPGTVSDLLDGKRNAQAKTQAALEAALKWVPGTYRRLSLGQLDRPERRTEEVAFTAADNEAMVQRFQAEARKVAQDPDELDRALLALVQMQSALLKDDLDEVKRCAGEFFLPAFWILTDLARQARIAQMPSSPFEPTGTIERAVEGETTRVAERGSAD